MNNQSKSKFERKAKEKSASFEYVKIPSEECLVLEKKMALMVQNSMHVVAKRKMYIRSHACGMVYG